MAHTYSASLTAAFRRELRKWLTDNPRSKAKLAAAVGVTPPTIDKMLDPATASSAHRDAVAEYCGIDVLLIESDEEKDRRIMDRLRQAPREVKDRYLEILDEITSERK